MANKRLPESRDPIQPGAFMVDIATGQVEDRVGESLPDPAKNPAAVALGRLGGPKGGVARAKKLTPEKRSKIAQKAALSLW